MDRTWSESSKGFFVRFARVALMSFKAIARPSFCCADHEAVTGVLGKNRGGHDFVHSGIALDDCLTGNVHIGAFVAVHKKDVGYNSSIINLFSDKEIGTFHGKYRGLEDVDFIDLLGACPCYGPSDGLFFDDRFYFKTTFLGKALRVIKDFKRKVTWKDDCSCAHWACKRASARLIGTDYDVVFGLFKQCQLLFHGITINQNATLVISGNNTRNLISYSHVPQIG